MKVYIAKTEKMVGEQFLFDMSMPEYDQTSQEQMEAKVEKMAQEYLREKSDVTIFEAVVKITDYGVYVNRDKKTLGIFVRFSHSKVLMKTTDKTEWNRFKLTKPQLIFEELDE